MTANRIRRCHPTAQLVLGLLIWAGMGKGIALGQNSGTTLVPSSATVAILPVVNKTGLKDDSEMAHLTKAVSAEIYHQLAGRGFKVVQGKQIEDAIDHLKIDLKDEEQQKRAILRSVGKAVGADMVAFVVVTDVDSSTEGGFGISDAAGNAKIKCWLLDVGSEHSLMSAKVEAARSDSGIRLGAFGGQFPKMAQATVSAVIHAFERVLKPYPFVTKDAPTKGSG